jgi:hypothetical protein
LEKALILYSETDMRPLVLALAVLTIAAASAPAAVDGKLLSLAPSSSTVLAGIDVQRAAASRSGNVMLQQTIDGQGLTKLVAAVGLNVRRDLTQMLLIGTGQQLNAESRYTLLARGEYTPARLIAAAKSRGASIRRDGAVTVISVGAGKSPSAVAFVRPGVLVLGSPADVHAMLAPAAHPGDIEPALREQADRIGAQNDIWYATSLSGSFLAQEAGDALPPALRGSGVLDRISRSSGGLQFGSNDELTLGIVASSPGDARLLSDALRVASRLARLQLGGDADFVLAQSVLSSMRVTVEGLTVHAVSAVPDGQLERALTTPK